jgi:hypothetical protein
MARKAEYRILAGSEREIEAEIARLNVTGQAHWTPVLMTSSLLPKGTRLYVMVEHRISE